MDAKNDDSRRSSPGADADADAVVANAGVVEGGSAVANGSSSAKGSAVPSRPAVAVVAGVRTAAEPCGEAKADGAELPALPTLAALPAVSVDGRMAILMVRFLGAASGAAFSWSDCGQLAAWSNTQVSNKLIHSDMAVLQLGQACGQGGKNVVY